MELTSQTWSLTCLMPAFWPANIVLRLIFYRLKQTRPQANLVIARNRDAIRRMMDRGFVPQTAAAGHLGVVEAGRHASPLAPAYGEKGFKLLAHNAGSGLPTSDRTPVYPMATSYDIPPKLGLCTSPAKPPA
jgi:hypothetical protein